MAKVKRYIRFRARTEGKNPSWVYGFYEEYVIPLGKNSAVMHTFNDWNLNGSVAVDSDTVGQYTGLHDKSGKEIYEGDVVRYKYYNRGGPDKNVTTAVVEYQGNSFVMVDKVVGSRLLIERCEIIGNIHDNPELCAGAN